MSINSITYSEYSSSQKYNTDNKGSNIKLINIILYLLL